MPQQMPKSFVPDEPAAAGLPTSFKGTEPKKASVLDLARAIAGVVVDPLSKGDPEKKKTFTEGSIGAAKGSAGWLLDASQAATPLDLSSHPVVKAMTEAARPQGAAQEMGSLVPDALMTLIPAINAARAPQQVQKYAAGVWKRAAQRPILESDALSEGVLKRGLGRLTEENARRVRELNPGSKTAWEFFNKALETAQEPGMGQTIGKTATGMLSPSLRAGLAQQMYTHARPLAGIKGGASPAVADILARFLRGQ